MHALGEFDAEPGAEGTAVRAAKGDPLVTAVAIVTHGVNQLCRVLQRLVGGEVGEGFQGKAAVGQGLAIEAVLNRDDEGLVLGGQLRDEILANAVVGALGCGIGEWEKKGKRGY